MTNKEAIEQLKWVQKRICDITYSPESFEAIDLATKALEESEQLAEWLKELKAYKEASKGDLISREALKKCAIPCQIHNGALTDLCVPLYQIDNAPTVEPRIEFGTDGQPYRLFMSGGQVVPDTLHGWRYEERPQGEWIFVSRHCYKCPFCNELSKGKNYCPNCGADMRGDKND